MTACPKPMLSASLDGVDLSTLRYPLMLSPKLDGVRCIVWEGIAYSRNLKPIRSGYVQTWAKKFHNIDGELICGRPTDPHCLNNTQSGVMSFRGGQDFMFYLFDSPERATPEFRNSDQFLNEEFRAEERIKIVPQIFVDNEAELLAREIEYLSLGYEGVMLRSPDGPYKPGRSTLREGYLMKLKRFMDGEARIVGFEEAQENQNEATTDALGRTKRSHHQENLVGKGMVGTILVRDHKFGNMRLSPGTMDHAERLHYFNHPNELIGRLAHWRAFGYGMKDTPRFPRFYGFREDLS